MNSQLFYVVGASGAGKDTLCDRAREALSGRVPLHFAHRYITRDARAGGENHVALSHGEFCDRRRHGLFAMDWEGHGNRYGIGIEVDFWLRSGVSVVVNASRGYLDEAILRYPEMVVVQVEVSQEVQRERLLARGRETPMEIDERLRRTEALPPICHPTLCRLSNDGAIDVAVCRFVWLLRSRLPKASAVEQPLDVTQSSCSRRKNHTQVG